MFNIVLFILRVVVKFGRQTKKEKRKQKRESLSPQKPDDTMSQPPASPTKGAVKTEEPEGATAAPAPEAGAQASSPRGASAQASAARGAGAQASSPRGASGHSQPGDKLVMDDRAKHKVSENFSAIEHRIAQLEGRAPKPSAQPIAEFLPAQHPHLPTEPTPPSQIPSIRIRNIRNRLMPAGHTITAWVPLNPDLKLLQPLFVNTSDQQDAPQAPAPAIPQPLVHPESLPTNCERPENPQEEVEGHVPDHAPIDGLGTWPVPLSIVPVPVQKQYYFGVRAGQGLAYCYNGVKDQIHKFAAYHDTLVC